MTDTAEREGTKSGIVDFYDELGLNRDDSIQQIQEALSLQKPEWASRRGRAGAKGEAARERLKLIEAAEEAFTDEDARDAYDRSLARRPDTTVADDTKVDWLGRAWSYYFVRDYGAAAVAARKAREQAPDDPMPYVVSAWTNLADQELRRAKSDADEAFVLDDVGEDTADVQQVRGAVFYSQGAFDRAIQSYERAFAKSSDVGKADLLLRKAWAFEYKDDGEAALASALQGFELIKDVPREEIPTMVLDGLVEAVIRCVDYLAGTVSYPTKSAEEQAPEPRVIITKYKSLRSRVSNSALFKDAADRVTRHIDKRLEVENLRIKMGQLEAVQPPDEPQPGLPLTAMGIGFVGLLMTGAWTGFLLVTLACAGWVAYVFTKRSQWTGLVGSYESSQRELQSTQSRWQAKRNAVDVVSTPVPLAFLDGR